MSPAEYHILLALADGDRHGYGIMQEVEADTEGQVRLGPGTLYGAIKRLLASDHIREVAEGVDAELNDTRRKYYRLTAAGRKALVTESERLENLVRLAHAKRVLLRAAPGNGS